MLIEDTTQLDYSGRPAAEDLGLVGEDGRGLWLHSTLAMKVVACDLEQHQEPVAVGLLSQQRWVQRRRPPGETRSQRVWRSSRMSKRWAEVHKN